jgi:type VI secretion system protein VasD
MSTVRKYRIQGDVVLPGVVLGMVLWLGGCASTPAPTEVTGTVRAAANANPSVARRPSPLLVRVYELKAATAFNNADFVSLYQRDQAELGAEMIGREELIVSPGESRALSKMTSPETRFVGVLAAYRDIDRARWRSVVAIQPGQKQRLTISAEELSVSATLSK